MSTAIDWRDAHDIEGQVYVEMVDPANLNSSRGILEGVELGASSIEYAYYSDTRVTGSLRVVGDGYIRGSFLRVWYKIPALGYAEELGTFIVTADNATYENGAWYYDLELHSVLYGVSLNIAPKSWTIAKNATALKAQREMLKANNRAYVETNVNDYKFSANRTFEGGESYLTRLYALCELTRNRMDVDGHGRVTFTKYVRPSSKGSVYTLDLEDARGIVEDGVTLTTNYLEMPGRAAVRHSYTVDGKDGKSVEREIVAWADAKDNRSLSSRGYLVVDLHDLDDLNPRTQARAQELANRYLKEDSAEAVEWELNTLYLPARPGDVLELVVPRKGALERYSGRRKVMVKNKTVELGTLKCSWTLKEAAAITD